jgi:nitrous oxide reductase
LASELAVSNATLTDLLLYTGTTQKDKNKELEAKARDMERKWNQEKALREVAETRVKVLKKKLKAMEIQSGDADTRGRISRNTSNKWLAFAHKFHGRC